MEFTTCIPSSEWDRKLCLDSISFVFPALCICQALFSQTVSDKSEWFGAGGYIFSGDMATGTIAFYFHKSFKNSLRMMCDKTELITMHRR